MIENKTKIIISNSGHEWTYRDYKDFQIWSAGDSEFTRILLEKKSKNFDVNKIKDILKNINKNFSCIIKTKDDVYAIVDHCRSIPIFYSIDEFSKDIIISNSAKTIKQQANLNDIDKVSALEIAMAGYVTGYETLYKNLFQLKAGEFLFCYENNHTKCKYYDYLPENIFNCSESEMSKKFGAILDKVIIDTIEKANGRKIWLPLSAGLDSRLLLCKFIEHKYKNVFTFSYGPNNNDEAKAASLIAKILGVAWLFVCSTRGYMKSFFVSRERESYWDYSDNLCSIPTFQDYLALSKLNHKKKLPQNILMVNGQTGDFISGGHIPKQLMQENVTIDDLLESIISKHYSLWDTLKTSGNITIIKQKILKVLDLRADGGYSQNELIAAYEKWEYQERQSKYVVNGQRNYEFLGLDWSLPFWDKRIVQFWKRVPFEYKFKQRLYKYFLYQYDFRKLFSNKDYIVWQWPGFMKIILPICRVIRLTLGYKARDNFIKAMLYFGMYRDLYAHLTYKEFFKYYRDARNPVSFFSKQWLVEKGVKFDSI